MRKKIPYLSAVLFMSLSLTGCAALIIGGALGAAGGYAVSKDTIQGETDKAYDSLWSAALTVAKIRGTIKEEDKTKGYIELEAEASRVSIELEKLTKAATRIKVTARKYHFPNLSLAQDIYLKVMNEAK